MLKKVASNPREESSMSAKNGSDQADRRQFQPGAGAGDRRAGSAFR